MSDLQSAVPNAVEASPKRRRSMGYAVLRLVIWGVIAIGMLWLCSGLYLNLQRHLWYYRFERAINEGGEVRLGDLVGFEWNIINIVRPYDLAQGLYTRTAIFGSDTYGGIWWANDPRYWTIVYRRPGRSPFIVWMEYREWGLAGRHLSSVDKNVEFLLVEPGKGQEYGSCSPRSKRCIMLFDNRTVPETAVSPKQP
jgi:hypothetical protein